MLAQQQLLFISRLVARAAHKVADVERGDREIAGRHTRQAGVAAVQLRGVVAVNALALLLVELHAGRLGEEDLLLREAPLAASLGQNVGKMKKPCNPASTASHFPTQFTFFILRDPTRGLQ